MTEGRTPEERRDNVRKGCLIAGVLWVLSLGVAMLMILGLVTLIRGAS